MKPAGPSPVVTIDVAHPPMSSDQAERALEEILRKATLSEGTRVIRVIHGYGSGGKGGTLKTAVRNWAYRKRNKFETILPGEEYSPFLPAMQELFKSIEGLGLSDLSDTNEGMTLLILK